MSVPRRATLASLLGALAVAALALPTQALAHGIVGRADLPIPVWLFSWAAAIVLVVSFVALSTLWRTPQLQEPLAHTRVLLALPAPLEWLAGLAGVGLFAVVIYSGFDGAQVPNANFSVTFIYVIFWVGMPVLSVLFGDLFRAFSPWRACARAGWAIARALPGDRTGAPVLAYPRRLGMWPAVAGIVGFAWLELVYIYPDKDRPSTLAALSLAYFVACSSAWRLFGVEQWGGQADGFGAYFNLLGRLSAVFKDRDGTVRLRRPLSGITDLEIGAGTVAMVCTIIGTTTFDGFSNGGVWRNLEPELQSLVADLGFNVTPSIELTYSLGCSSASA